MNFEVNVRRRKLFFALAALTVIVVSGCSNGSAGSNMSAEDYKKAAMGSKMSPTEEASMRAAIKKGQADSAAREAAAPHGPPTSAVQPK